MMHQPRVRLAAPAHPGSVAYDTVSFRLWAFWSVAVLLIQGLRSTPWGAQWWHWALAGGAGGSLHWGRVVPLGIAVTGATVGIVEGIPALVRRAWTRWRARRRDAQP